MGAGHFSGDFTHQFEFKWFDEAEAPLGAAYWMLTDSIEEYDEQVTAGTYLAIWHNMAAQPNDIVLIFSEDGAQTTDRWSDPCENTVIYVTVARDDDANGQGWLHAYFRITSHEGDVKAHLSVDCNDQEDFRYVCALNNQTAAGAASHYDGSLQNLELNEAAGGTSIAVFTNTYRRRRNQ